MGKAPDGLVRTDTREPGASTGAVAILQPFGYLKRWRATNPFHN